MFANDKGMFPPGNNIDKGGNTAAKISGGDSNVREPGADRRLHDLVHRVAALYRASQHSIRLTAVGAMPMEATAP